MDREIDSQKQSNNLGPASVPVEVRDRLEAGMSEELTLSVEAQAELGARKQTDRKISLDWSQPSTWVIYGFGALGLVLVSFLIFGFVFIRAIPAIF